MSSLTNKRNLPTGYSSLFSSHIEDRKYAGVEVGIDADDSLWIFLVTDAFEFVPFIEVGCFSNIYLCSMDGILLGHKRHLNEPKLIHDSLGQYEFTPSKGLPPVDFKGPVKFWRVCIGENSYIESEIHLALEFLKEKNWILGVLKSKDTPEHKRLIELIE